jgi:hypothetical protein
MIAPARVPVRTNRISAAVSLPIAAAFLVGIASAFALTACSSAPEAPPGGEAASKAAYAEGEAYAKGLRRGIEGGKRDRAMADLANIQRALEQYVMDQSSYPPAGSCAELFAAATLNRPPAPPDRDPWGVPYECRASADGYSIRSAGEDGVAGNGDDVVVEGGRPPAP